MSEPRTWKEQLGDRIPEALGTEIDQFETQLELRRQDKIDEVIFAETRLRRGVYGQRYDNGQALRRFGVPGALLPRGKDQGPQHGLARPWHAAHQDSLRRVEYRTDGYARRHRGRNTPTGSPTLRPGQDVQLHYVHIDDTIDLMRRLRFGWNHHPGGVRQLGAQRYRLPPVRSMPHRSLRRDPVCECPVEVSSRPPGCSGFRPQIQTGLVGMQA